MERFDNPPKKQLSAEWATRRRMGKPEVGARVSLERHKQTHAAKTPSHACSPRIASATQ